MSLGSFQKLPSELLVEVEGFLPLDDRLSLSTTNRTWRDFLLPRLYACLRITNRHEDQEILADVLDKYGSHMRRLYFEFYLYPNGEKEGDDVEEERGQQRWGLPELTCKLLAGACDTLTVDFKPEDNFDFDGWDSDMGSIYMHGDPEDRDSIANSECEYLWRATMAQMWESVATNESLRKVTIVNLPPRGTTTWFTEEWFTFLGQLVELSVNIWGGDNGAGWTSNTTEGYLDFLTNMDSYFFRHTKSLRRLSIIANSESPWGCEGMRQAPLDLDPSDMPKLEYLYLENCFIDSAIVSFMQAHAKVLKQMHLQKCMAGRPSDIVDLTLSWAEIFRAVHTGRPILEDLRIINPKAPLTEEENYAQDMEEYMPPDDEPENIKTIRGAIKEEGRKLLSSNYRDDNYGMVFSYEDINVEEFEAGEDQRDYDALMELVQRNANSRKR